MFDPKDMVTIDGMHTIGGVLQCLFKLFFGRKDAPRTHRYELAINQRAFKGSHIAGVKGMRGQGWWSAAAWATGWAHRTVLRQLLPHNLLTLLLYHPNQASKTETG